MMLLSKNKTGGKGLKWVALLPAFLFCFAGVVTGQNINTPNKKGPMGLQVNTLSGNLFLPRTDFIIPARGFNLDATFFYNSFNQAENTGFGNGWSFSYNIKYRNDTAGGKTIVWGDGREDSYTASGSGTFKSPTGFFTTFLQYSPNKFSLAETDGTKYFFDNSTHKRITGIQNPNGNALAFQYTDTLLTAITTSAGQALTLSYNNGRLTSLTDAISSPVRSFTYTYDAAGNLSQVKDPMNNSFLYRYLVNGPLKAVTDKNKNVVDIIYYANFLVSEMVGCNKRVSFSYDSASLTTYVTDHLEGGNNQVTRYEYKQYNDHFWLSKLSGNCCGFNKAFEFDAQGNKSKETDANGNVTMFTYDSRSNLLSITDALGQKESYTYSADFNRVISYTDKKGFITTMTYDNRGNLTQIIEPGNLVYTATYNTEGDITGSTDPKGNAFTYHYDAFGNPVSVSGPDGFNAALAYDARGSLLSATDARGNKSNLEYDILGRLKKISNAHNSTISFAYDAMDNPVSLTNQDNEARLLSFNASNRLVAFTDALGKKSFFTHDAMDNIKSFTNALGHTFNFTYDTRSRLSGFTDPAGNSMGFSYDQNGNVKTASFPNGRIFNYTYDVLDRISSFSDNSGEITSVTYDKNDNITSYTNATGNIMTAVYDNLNRVVKITDALGNVKSFIYDNNNNITSTTDRLGNTKTFTYDGNNRPKTVTDHSGAVIAITYDAAGNITQLKDQNNNVTTYAYDAMNRNTTITYPGGRFIQFTYDKKSNVTSKRLTDGTSISYTYDSLDRLVQKTLPDGHVYTYAYDALGRVNAVTNNAGAVTFAYDGLHRVIAETYDGRTVAYKYNTAGRTQTTIYPDGTAVTNTYDIRNRLLSIAKNNVTLTTYEYNKADQVTKTTFANGVVTNFQYDFANRLTNLSTGNGTIQNSVYSYNNKYHKTAISRLNNPVLSEQFTYDNKYQLTQYKRGDPGGAPTLQNSYTYDALGNRVSASLNGIATTYTSNSLNQLTTVNGSSAISLAYDNNGNRTFNGKYYKSYDAEGKLLKDSASPVNVLTYQYDALGRRVLKTINGQPFKYTYSGLAPIEEREGLTNSLLNRTIFSYYLLPVMNEKEGQSYFYHQNEMASVEAITAASGNIVERYVYDAFGKPTIYGATGNVLPGSVAGNRFMFTGQEWDSATGSYRFLFRNYSPETGTFDQPDPIGYDDGMGMYQYVGNNPANGIDVLGLNNSDCDQKTRSTIDEIEKYNSWASGLGDIAKRVIENPEFKQKKILELLIKYHDALGNKIEVLENAGKSKEAGKVLDQLIKTFDQIQDLKNLKLSPEAAGKLAKAVKGLDYGGKGLGLLDFGIKADKAGTALGDYFGGTGDGYEATKATGNLIQSGLGFTPIGGAYNLFDFVQEKFITGRSMNDNAEVWGQGLGKLSHEADMAQARWTGVGDYSDEAMDRWHWEQGNFAKWERARRRIEEREVKNRKPNCPQNGDNGGTRKRRPPPPGFVGPIEILASSDPNEIIGPDGVGAGKWVSVNDRLPYTITYENDKSATAPAKFVKITTPVQPKMNAATFELGSFGFNSLTFAIPSGSASFYQRVDARDSLGLYVDVTAGYDQLKNEAFWEFQSIDPLTLLPPADPLKGFLLLQDSSNKTYGHGFVNFSIKPVSNALTGDTISAVASIIFDQNEVIPTNRHKNTVDAVPPVSQLASTALFLSPNTFQLNWTAGDDAGGSGVASYSVYVSVNGRPYTQFRKGIPEKSLVFNGIKDTSYCFFVTAKDSTGNEEALKNNCETSVVIIGTPLPLTWLDFNGVRREDDALLKWITSNEIRTQSFVVERSLDGTNFSAIAVLGAMGGLSVNNYSFTDRGISVHGATVIYYRIRQVDNDGRFTYSKIIAIRLEQAADPLITAFPNPFSQVLTVQVTPASIQDVTGTLELYTLQGTLVYRREVNRQGLVTSVLTDLPLLASGVYMLKTTVNGVAYATKVVKK